MKIKTNAVLLGLQLPMRKVLIEANKIWKDNGQELVITEGTGGVHSAGSLHPFGYALDLRTRYFKENGQVSRVAEELRKKLKTGYDIIIHKTHIHAEYDKIIHA